jgi:hypothetical protein
MREFHEIGGMKVEEFKIQDNIEEIKVEDNGESNSAQKPKTKDKILELIRASDADGGLDIDKVIMSMKEPVEEINREITILLEDGSIYEPKPGRLRIL